MRSALFKVGIVTIEPLADQHHTHCSCAAGLVLDTIGALASAYATLRTIQVDYGLKDHQIVELSIYNTVAEATQSAAFMGMADIPISIGKDWQGVVAQRMGYAVVLVSGRTVRQAGGPGHSLSARPGGTADQETHGG